MWLKLFVIQIIVAVISGYEKKCAAPVVNITGLGLVCGSTGRTAWTEKDVYKFQGIHYGVAPVGNLRFKPTKKVGPWDGIKNATQAGVRCPQITESYVNVDNEDCLTLSVYTSDLNAARPVMVFIHGGWFYTGGADAFQPDYLLESDVVLVAIQYRLGPLGFLSTMSQDIPGNVGLLDVITALEWVQQNIHSFGGNSSVVTIFGQSAGASSVSAMLHSPLVQDRKVPLFQRAILQSGSLLVPRHIADDPVGGAKDIANRLGCKDTQIEDCFREAPIKNLLEAFMDHRAEAIRSRGFPSIAASNIAIGGPSGLFPQHPKYYMRNSKKGIAVMAGTVADDGLFLWYEINRFQSNLPKSLNSTNQLLDFIRILHEKFGQTRLDGVLESLELVRYFADSDFHELRWKNLLTSIADICAAHGVKGPVLTEVREINQMNSGNVYLYSFDYSETPTEETPHDLFPYKGAVNHADDLQYLFPLKTMDADGIAVAKTMVELWTSFATNGVPRAQNVPSWPSVGDFGGNPLAGLIPGVFGPYMKINAKSELESDYREEFLSTSRRFRTRPQKL
ncbi:glutactin-like [Armigeres subalbatus]|uniref:glutactin-like n=1 Tax=Armigeres subalbatus TaxID=124917 RepID=UPI002ED16681